jgi:hypothetical protein
MHPLQISILTVSPARTWLLIAALLVWVFPAVCQPGECYWQVTYVLDPDTGNLLDGDERFVSDQLKKEGLHYIFLGGGFDGQYVVSVNHKPLHSGYLRTAPSSRQVPVEISFTQLDDQPTVMSITDGKLFSMDAPFFLGYAYVYVDFLSTNRVNLHYTNSAQTRE